MDQAWAASGARAKTALLTTRLTKKCGATTSVLSSNNYPVPSRPGQSKSVRRDLGTLKAKLSLPVFRESHMVLPARPRSLISYLNSVAISLHQLPDKTLQATRKSKREQKLNRASSRASMNSTAGKRLESRMLSATWASPKIASHLAITRPMDLLRRLSFNGTAIMSAHCLFTLKTLC